MTQSEKQLLLKDLCARLPYEVKCNVGNITVTLEGITNNGEAFADDSYFDAYDMKPYLRPMSSMTKEECEELGELPAIIENVCEILPNVPYYIEVARPEQLDWLNAHHFDYRGLIKKGLALEAPKGMYKTD